MLQANRKGFTLIELLVVVAIIALLIAILLPSLGKARDRAKTTACASNFHSLYLAMTNYSGEYEGTILPARTQTGSAQSFQWDGVDTLGPEMGLNRVVGGDQTAMVTKVRQMLHCPAQQVDPNGYLVALGVGKTAPNGQAGRDGNVNDYTYNENLGDGGNLTKFPFQKLQNLRPDIMAITELHPFNERGKDDWDFDSVDRLLTGPQTGSDHGSTPMGWTPHISNTKANILFIDGSIVTDRLNLLADPPPPPPPYPAPNSTTHRKDYLVSPTALEGLNGPNPFK